MKICISFVYSRGLVDLGYNGPCLPGLTTTMSMGEVRQDFGYK